MTIQEWIQTTTRRFTDAGIDSPRLDAEVLAAHVLRVDRSWLFAHPEHEFHDLAGETLAQRREDREPLAYILGWREFYGRRFRINRDALIPRQETEVLVEWALELSGPHTLDIGTGSGCIAITLQLERPYWDLTATEIVPWTLNLARTNAEELGAHVAFVQTDLAEGLPEGYFDLIVSNPPYIAEHEPLMPEVGRHEPSRALFAAEDGFEMYGRLAREVKNNLKPGGNLLVEIGQGQGERIRSLFASQGWGYLGSRLDLAGIERVLGFSRQVVD